MSATPAWAERIRTIPDFPQPGVQFKDITPLLSDGAAFRAVIDAFVARYRGVALDAIVGIESRGFIFGAPLALELGIGLVPVRKPGKLPAETVAVDYALEYGTNRLEMHRDALPRGARVLIVDDVLATGGTVAATRHLLEQVGLEVVESAFVIELTFLGGRERLAPHPLFALLSY